MMIGFRVFYGSIGLFLAFAAAIALRNRRRVVGFLAPGQEDVPVSPAARVVFDSARLVCLGLLLTPMLISTSAPKLLLGLEIVFIVAGVGGLILRDRLTRGINPEKLDPAVLVAGVAKPVLVLGLFIAIFAVIMQLT